MRIALLLLAQFGACAEGADEGLPGADQGAFIEAYCFSHPEVPCGHVWTCTGAGEICIDDDHGLIERAEWTYGTCELSTADRFNGHPICLWQCPSDARCNATDGCFCP